jgi:hypothetical protein
VKSLVPCALVALAVPAAAFSPVLEQVQPRGGQRGTEVEVSFIGQRLKDIQEALFYQPGISLHSLEEKDDKTVVGKFAIAEDAALGEHSLRLRSSHGVTDIRSFWVGQFPTLDEVEPNNGFDEAQRVELNTTVHGVAGNEDEDFYVVSLKKGQRLSVEAEAMRLGRVLFDSYLSILNPQGREIAFCDDVPLLRTDSFISLLAPEDGDYRIVMREAAYEGSDASQYRLHIGTFPRPAAVHPLGGKPGETLEFTFIGDPSGPIRQTITLPDDASGMHPVFPQHDGLFAPSPHWIQVSPLEHATGSGQNTSLAEATAFPAVPGAVHGILSQPDSSGWFKFDAKKGQNYVIRALARQLRSPIDTVVSIHTAQRQLALNDDQGGPDSVLPWECPEDGEYFIRVRDQLERGGDDFTYRIEINPRSSAVAANLPTVERTRSQMWKVFSIPRGNRYAAVVNLTRENTGEALLFEAGSLPPGVTMHCPPVPRGTNSIPVVFEAAADAEIGGALHPFTVRTTGDGPELRGSLVDTIHHIDINNQGTYHSIALDRIPVAVTTAAPYSIHVETPPVPLVKNGKMRLKVRADRSDGFEGKITLRLLWTPPGVTGPVTVDIPEKQNEALYELDANNDAAVSDWSICLLGLADTPQGPTIVSSALVPLKVSEPFLTMSLELAAGEIGKNSSMLGKIELLTDFDGEAVVELTGLPHGVTAEPVKISKDMEEVTFPISLAPDAKVGKHQGVFCRIQVPANGTQILHQTAHGGTIRIDNPPPAPVVAQAEAPKTEEATASTTEEKPLSRLEQLRQRAAN